LCISLAFIISIHGECKLKVTFHARIHRCQLYLVVFFMKLNIQKCQHLFLILQSTAHFCQHNLQNWLLLLLLLAEIYLISNNIQAN